MLPSIRFRSPSLAAFAAASGVLLAAPGAARAQAAASAASAATPAAPTALPAGWSMRLDRDGAPATGVSFAKMGNGWHATTGPAAVFYNPQTTATGTYAVDATFTQTKAPAHAEAYGLVFGASKLETPQQSYYYYVVRGDGQYLLKHRAGSEVHTLQDWTPHAALKKADAAGKATNALRVQVDADSLRFFANGTQVRALPKVTADGIVGLRINHNLDVHVDGPRVTRAAR